MTALRKTMAFLMFNLFMLISTNIMAENPRAYPDGSWISVSGSVVAADPSHFTLDYGEGLILVEVDDWEWYDQEGRGILPGDEVVVHGRIDNSLYENKSIEAGSVYVKGLNTYFYASSADEEGDVHANMTYTAPLSDGSWMSVTGTVSKVKGREITINTGIGKVQVDTRSMDYNPVDNIGYQQIDEGDVVTVNGHLDVDFFEKKEIMADNIITLDNNF